jgi:hypothetical protein
VRHRKPDRELAHVRGAEHGARGSTGTVQRGQEQADEDGNDRDHDQQLDDREGIVPPI